MTDKNTLTTKDELMELYDDIKVIEEKKPEMLPVLIGVIKGIRLSSESIEQTA